MVARKGQDVLVRALPAIREQVPGTRLLLVGDGPHRQAVERLAAATGVAEHVVLAGRVPWKDTPAYYDAGDVFCMPTRTRLGGLEPEALGICYLEAAATGIPVVAGDSGGAPDAVLDGENGFVVDGRSPEQVADRVGAAAARPRAGAAVRRPRPGLGHRAVGLAGAGRPPGRAARAALTARLTAPDAPAALSRARPPGRRRPAPPAAPSGPRCATGCARSAAARAWPPAPPTAGTAAGP